MHDTMRVIVSIGCSIALTAFPASTTAATTTPTTAPQAFKEIEWDDLMPTGWDPYKQIKSNKVGMLSDSDPEIVDLMSQMREVWDKAPTVAALEGRAVKIPGYIVPLDESHGQMKEFLLVPYFGACIHTPPPPANQIIHVFAKTPVKGYRSMDTVWVRGAITQTRKDSYMGMSGYEIQADGVDRYESRKH